MQTSLKTMMEESSIVDFGYSLISSSYRFFSYADILLDIGVCCLERTQCFGRNDSRSGEKERFHRLYLQIRYGSMVFSRSLLHLPLRP